MHRRLNKSAFSKANNPVLLSRLPVKSAANKGWLSAALPAGSTPTGVAAGREAGTVPTTRTNDDSLASTRLTRRTASGVPVTLRMRSFLPVAVSLIVRLYKVGSGVPSALGFVS